MQTSQTNRTLNGNIKLDSLYFKMKSAQKLFDFLNFSLKVDSIKIANNVSLQKVENKLW